MSGCLHVVAIMMGLGTSIYMPAPHAMDPEQSKQQVLDLLDQWIPANGALVLIYATSPHDKGIGECVIAIDASRNAWCYINSGRVVGVDENGMKFSGKVASLDGTAGKRPDLYGPSSAVDGFTPIGLVLDIRSRPHLYTFSATTDGFEAVGTFPLSDRDLSFDRLDSSYQSSMTPGSLRLTMDAHGQPRSITKMRGEQLVEVAYELDQRVPRPWSASTVEVFSRRYLLRDVQMLSDTDTPNSIRAWAKQLGQGSAMRVADRLAAVQGVADRGDAESRSKVTTESSTHDSKPSNMPIADTPRSTSVSRWQALLIAVGCVTVVVACVVWIRGRHAR